MMEVYELDLAMDQSYHALKEMGGIIGLTNMKMDNDHNLNKEMVCSICSLFILHRKLSRKPNHNLYFRRPVEEAQPVRKSGMCRN